MSHRVRHAAGSSILPGYVRSVPGHRLSLNRLPGLEVIHHLAGHKQCIGRFKVCCASQGRRLRATNFIQCHEPQHEGAIRANNCSEGFGQCFAQLRTLTRRKIRQLARRNCHRMYLRWRCEDLADVAEVHIWRRRASTGSMGVMDRPRARLRPSSPVSTIYVVVPSPTWSRASDALGACAPLRDIRTLGIQ